MIFRDTHEAIVDEETWQLAHRLRKIIRKPSYPDRPANPLTGLLYCADCTIHYIKTSTIEKLVLAAIREVSAYVTGRFNQKAVRRKCQREDTR